MVVWGNVSDRIKSNLDLSRKSTKKLLSLVEEILDLSKLEAGKLELNLQSIKLIDLIKRIFYTYESSSSTKNITLDLQYNLDEATCVKIDIGKLEKVLDNLLSNAVKFTEADGKISLKVDKKNAHILIHVEDDGIGIDQNELQQIFDRFYQAGKGNKYTGGTGIGLSLAKELAQLMGGDLSVDSALGNGTTFELSIPLVVADQESVQIIDAEEHTDEDPDQVIDFDPSGYKTTRILIVEDNEQMRNYIKSQLYENYQIDEAEDGMDALEKIDQNDYQLIISDLMMPKLDGFDLVAKLKEDERTASISVIMLTARAGEKDIIEGLTIGLDDYMTKPFNPDELKVRVFNILNNRQARLQSRIEDAELSADDRLVNQMKASIQNHINDSSFGVSALADEVAISERQLNRNIKKITGLTAGNFIREVRLN